MSKIDKIKVLLRKSGYSQKAIDYYMKKVNVGEIKSPEAHFVYTGPCGDTVEIFLRIKKGVIKDAKFQAIGCAGSFSSGSALCEIVKGRTPQEAEKITEEDIINHLGELPAPKVHCACLVKKTLVAAIKRYRGETLPDYITCSK
jgi:nitrogen fixation NifU-like protein